MIFVCAMSSRPAMDNPQFHYDKYGSNSATSGGGGVKGLVGLEESRIKYLKSRYR